MTQPIDLTLFYREVQGINHQNCFGTLEIKCNESMYDVTIKDAHS